MHWIAPSKKDSANAAGITSLSASERERAGVRGSASDAAEQFRANSGLKFQEYSIGRRQGPVLGLIFLRFAEVRFAAKRAQLESPSPLGGEWAGVRGEPSGASSTTGTVARRVSASDSANQFYTPSNIVRPLTEVIEPYHGRILETLRLADSRCVNRGMNRVKSRRVREHKQKAAAGNANAINALNAFSI